MTTSTVGMIQAWVPIISTAVTALFTLLLLCVAYTQLKEMNRQASSEFLFKFRTDFFEKKRNQEILKIIEEGLPLLKQNGGNFDEYDIDEYLDIFDLAGNFIKQGSLDFNLLDEAMGSYIVKAYDNDEIMYYVKTTRNNERDDRYFKPFEELAKKLKQKESIYNKVFESNI